MEERFGAAYTVAPHVDTARLLRETLFLEGGIVVALLTLTALLPAVLNVSVLEAVGIVGHALAVVEVIPNLTAGTALLVLLLAVRNYYEAQPLE